MKLIFFLLLLFFSNSVFCQLKVGFNSKLIDSSAMFQIDVSQKDSFSKGVLLPRLSSRKRGLIRKPAIGLTIYNTDLKCIESYDSKKWQPQCFNRFNTLPNKVIVGYASSWNSSVATFIPLSRMKNNKYNVIIFPFITIKSDGFTPEINLSTPPSAYSSLGKFDSSKLQADVFELRTSGKPVLVALGGASTVNLNLNDSIRKKVFVKGIIDLIEYYGFDGIDINLEGSASNFGAGALKSFDYDSVAKYPKIRYLIDAIKEIDDYFGNGFILTMAPAIFIVNAGIENYINTKGSQLPLIDNLRDRIDLLMVQYYSTSAKTKDLYDSIQSLGTIDYLIVMNDILLNGFTVGTNGVKFKKIPADKIVLGLTPCRWFQTNYGFVDYDTIISGLDYIRFGIKPSPSIIKYVKKESFNNEIRGVMTWNIPIDGSNSTTSSPPCYPPFTFSEKFFRYFY
jgi:chitinase